MQYFTNHALEHYEIRLFLRDLCAKEWTNKLSIKHSWKPAVCADRSDVARQSRISPGALLGIGIIMTSQHYHWYRGCHLFANC